MLKSKNIKFCENPRCATEKTPLWRKGWHNSETGRKVRLCNACGLHFRKGHFCRYCNQIYKDNSELDMSEGWLNCQLCERRTHKSCAVSNGETIEATDESYFCRDCLPNKHSLKKKEKSSPKNTKRNVGDCKRNELAEDIYPSPMEPDNSYQRLGQVSPFSPQFVRSFSACTGATATHLPFSCMTSHPRDQSMSNSTSYYDPHSYNRNHGSPNHYQHAMDPFVLFESKELRPGKRTNDPGYYKAEQPHSMTTEPLLPIPLPKRMRSLSYPNRSCNSSYGNNSDASCAFGFIAQHRQIQAMGNNKPNVAEIPSSERITASDHKVYCEQQILPPISQILTGIPRKIM
jgi:hypothetical protein